MAHAAAVAPVDERASTTSGAQIGRPAATGTGRSVAPTTDPPRGRRRGKAGDTATTGRLAPGLGDRTTAPPGSHLAQRRNDRRRRGAARRGGRGRRPGENRPTRTRSAAADGGANSDRAG